MTIAFGLVWLGYGVAYYGWNRITGGNDKFVSLIWPGKYSPTARDSGAGGTAATTNTPGASSNTGGASQAAGKPAATVGLGPAPIPSIPSSGLLSGLPAIPPTPTGPTTTPVAFG
jgi:hypothetical protein